MRPSNYTITVRLPEKEKFLLFHGYSGAVEVVEPCVAELLIDPVRRIKDDNGTVSVETFKLLEKRGYLTDKTPAEETAFVKELGERVHRFRLKHSTAGFLIALRCPGASSSLRLILINSPFS